jgi:hypothetical protein
MTATTRRIVLLVLACVAFVVFAWIGFDHPSHFEFGWLGAGLALFAASFL